MKVILVNGSPHEYGCTHTALSEVAKPLNDNGIETTFFWIGKTSVSGCIACGQCAEKQACIFNDKVNEFTRMAKEADGFIFGSPVYYSGINGSMMSFMDRVFYSSSKKAPHPFQFKPAASVVSARRAGTTSAIDQMNKYFLFSQMVLVGSRYWPMVHGNTPDEVRQDEEGLQIMRCLGRNMAWMLKIKGAALKCGISLPKDEERRIYTNFIR